jgi:glycerol-3-phosphate dehydrogenase (NAD(P)+)
VSRRVAVLGAGSWGTTLADLLARQGLDVTLWAYEPDVVTAVNQAHENPVFLPGCPLAPSLRAAADAAVAARGAPVVLCAVPSHAMRTVLRAAAPGIAPDTILVSLTKGLEPETLRFPSEVAAETLPGVRFVALSGPSFAREVYDRQPTAVVAASRDAPVAAAIQTLVSAPHFRVYRNDDVVGTEIAGALKNVIAIAAGVLEGLGLGANPRAALITRGLAEITRLGLACGASARTFAGLAGLGDLVLTTTGALSRNRALGVALAQGQSLADYTAAHRTVAEGVNTARAAVQLGHRAGVELPITAQVAALLFEGKQPGQAIAELMDRALKPEQWT